MNKKGNYSFPEIGVWFFIGVFILLLIFWMNHKNLVAQHQTLQGNYLKLNESYNQKVLENDALKKKMIN